MVSVLLGLGGYVSASQVFSATTAAARTTVLTGGHVIRARASVL